MKQLTIILITIFILMLIDMYMLYNILNIDILKYARTILFDLVLILMLIKAVLLIYVSIRYRT